MITLTITTCKRYDLFKKTLESFSFFCQDINLITNIIHYDDSSSYSDRIKMYYDLVRLFPNTQIKTKMFDHDNLKTKKRHLEIMNHWKNDINQYEYVFHLEDDWQFINFFNLSESINLLKNNQDIALVGFSWEKKEFPTDLFIPKIIGNFWEWYYSEKHELNKPLFYDLVEMKYLSDTTSWIKYINWPYFGFRPAIHDVKKLNTLDEFNDSMDSFELEFAIRFAKKYKSFFHFNRICFHLGNETSSYILNNSER